MRRNERGFLIAVVAFMLWVRLRQAGDLVHRGEVLLLGNDPWYHWRASLWTAHNWPRMLQFDPWTGFPVGHAVGQFGTPFDLLVGTVALVAGLGDPSAGLWAAAAVPAVLGSLVAVPVYLLSRGLWGRDAAVASAVSLALMTGVFLHRGMYGFVDHHIMEVLLQVTAMLLVVRGVGRADKYGAAAHGAAAGAVTGVYLLVWPPAGYFFMITAATLMALSLVAFWSGRDGWQPPLLVLSWMSGATSVVIIPFVEPAVSLTTISTPHSLLTAMGFLGATAAYYLFRRAEAVGAGNRLVAGSLALAAVMGSAAALGMADLFGDALAWIEMGLLGRSGAGVTIAEAHGVGFAEAPMYFFGEYGFLFAAAFMGAVFLARRRTAGDALVLVWLVVTIAMATAQVRSNYYLAPIIAVAVGPVAVTASAYILESAEPDRPDLARLVLAVIVVSALALPAGGTLTADVGPSKAEGWQSTLDWMESSTPEPGLDYHGSYAPTDDFDYDTYGVMSWWDYGHYITAEAERIPVANPFQQHAREAARFFLATSETGADEAIEDLGPGAGEEVRYVVVDDMMATSKLWAMAEWAGVSPGRYHDDGAFTPAYRDTMVSSLYFGNANGLEHHRLVYASPERVTLASFDGSGPPRETSEAALEAARDDPDRSVTYVKSEPKVKVFERVEGARVTGPANGSTVSVRLQLRTNNGGSFTYAQTAPVRDGQFFMTVPYSSTMTLGNSVDAVGAYELYVDGEKVREFEVSDEAVEEGRVVGA